MASIIAPRFTTSTDTSNAVVIEPTVGNSAVGKSVRIYGIEVMIQTGAAVEFTFSDNDGNTILTFNATTNNISFVIPFLADNGFIIDALPSGAVIVYHDSGGA